MISISSMDMKYEQKTVEKEYSPDSAKGEAFSLHLPPMLDDESSTSNHDPGIMGSYFSPLFY